MDVIQVQPGDRKRLRQFVQFPFDLYRGAPGWSPESLVRDQYRQFDPDRHPFYAHSSAVFFLAVRGDRVVGRVAGINNRLFNEHRSSRTAFFGLLEFEDDPSVVAGLLGTVESWARSQGLDRLEGPRGLLGFDGGVRIEGFEQGPVLGVPYSHPYYDRRLRDAGLVPEEDFRTGWLRTETSIPDGIFTLADRVRERGTYRVHRFTSRRALRAWVPRITAAYLAAAAGLETFYPPSDTEVEDLVSTVLRVAEPRGISLVLAGDDVVGFLFSYPNLAPALRRSRGRLFPLGWWHLLSGRSRATWYCINGLGLHPDHRGRGANALLYARLAHTAEELGWEGGHVLQVATTNVASMKDMEKLATMWTITTRRYAASL